MRRLVLSVWVLAAGCASGVKDCSFEYHPPAPFDRDWWIDAGRVRLGDAPWYPDDRWAEPRPIAVGGTDTLRVELGPALTYDELEAFADPPDGFEVTVDGDLIHVTALREGEGTITLAADTEILHVPVTAIPIAAAIARPALIEEGLYAVDWSDADQPVRFADAPVHQITLGLLSADGERVADLGAAIVTGPSGVTWSRIDGDRFLVEGLPLGTTQLLVTAGATSLPLAIEVVDTPATIDVVQYGTMCPGVNSHLCAFARAGGANVVAPYSFSPGGTGRLTPDESYVNCVRVLLAQPGPDAVVITAGTTTVQHDFTVDACP